MPTKQKASTEVDDGIAAYEEAIKEGSTEGVLVEMAQREILRASGFVFYTTDPAMEFIHNEAIKEAAWQLTAGGAIVSTQDELDSLPIQRLALASKLLEGPEFGTDEWLAQDVVWRKGWTKAEQYVWKQLGHKYGDTVQRWTRERLNTDDQHHILVKMPDRVFITTEPKFAADVIYKKDEDKMEMLALSMGAARALFERQMPGLKGQGTSLKALGTRVSKKARAAYDAKALNGAEDEE